MISLVIDPPAPALGRAKGPRCPGPSHGRLEQGVLGSLDRGTCVVGSAGAKRADNGCSTAHACEDDRRRSGSSNAEDPHASNAVAHRMRVRFGRLRGRRQGCRRRLSRLGPKTRRRRRPRGHSARHPSARRRRVRRRGVPLEVSSGSLASGMGGLLLLQDRLPVGGAEQRLMPWPDEAPARPPRSARGFREWARAHSIPVECQIGLSRNAVGMSNARCLPWLSAARRGVDGGWWEVVVSAPRQITSHERTRVCFGGPTRPPQNKRQTPQAGNEGRVDDE